MSFSLLSQTQSLQNKLLDKKNSKNYMNYKRKKKGKDDETKK
jgi:hypothetical protein